MALRVRTLDSLSAADVVAVTALLHDLVADGAALGWTDPPDAAEVEALFAAVGAGTHVGNAAIALAVDGDAVDGAAVVGVGYWRRYERPTHRPHADLERIAVAAAYQGQGVGRRLTQTLIAAAREAGVEQLTLDLRADNAAALALYESLGFRRYGYLDDFVAVGDTRYDKLFYVLDLRATARR